MKTRHPSVVILCAFFFILSGLTSDRRSPFVEKIHAQLEVYNKTVPEEKIYVQVDKPFYKPGEDIWLNAFVLDANTHKPTTLSDVVYVALIDPKGNTVSTLDLLINEGMAMGDFVLPQNSPGGIYQIKAYTHWMKNFGEHTSFSRNITVQRVITPRLLLKLDYPKESYGAGEEVQAEIKITNLKNEPASRARVTYNAAIGGKEKVSGELTTDSRGIAIVRFRLPKPLDTADGILNVFVTHEGTEESISRSIPIVLNKVSLQFFPEGGYAIARLPNRIAFKAINEFGKAADVAGRILDSKGNTVTEFESFHMGMGAFDLRPLPGEQYFATIDRPFQGDSLFALPRALATGLHLHVAEAGENEIRCRIHSPSPQNAHLIATAHGEIYFGETLQLIKGENDVLIPTSNFPSGILVLTIFDENEYPVCERLVFVNRARELRIEISPDKSRYLPGEKATLRVRTSTPDGKPVSSRVSLSVVDDQLISFADDKQDNLLSRMLLSSEVKGKIQEPSFYFDPDEEKAEQALDYLLMTQGWRRYTWNDPQKNNFTINYAPEKIRDIRGTVLNDKDKGVGSTVTLIEIDGRKRLARVRTTGDGQFVFRSTDPSVPIFLLTQKDRTIRVDKGNGSPSGGRQNHSSVSLDGPNTSIAPAPSTPASPLQVSGPAEAANMLATADIGMNTDVTHLSECVVVVGYGAEARRSITGSVTTITADPISTLPITLDQYLQGRAPGLRIIPAQPGSPSRLVVRGPNSITTHGGPLYVVDGVPVGNSLNDNFPTGSLLDPNDITRIEILTGPEAAALFGSQGSGGVVLINTRSSASENRFPMGRRLSRYSWVRIDPRRFSSAREFYVPPPSVATDSERKDFRTTVYWNPSVITNEKGEATVSFTHNDGVSAFRITAEGFSGDGLLGRAEHVVSTILPLSLATKLPEFMGFEDKVRLPVTVYNETKQPMEATVRLSAPDALVVEDGLTRTVAVQPGTAANVYYVVRSKGIEGELDLALRVESGRFSDEVHHKLTVRRVGFPVHMSFSSQKQDQTINFAIRDAELHSIKARLTIYGHLVEDLYSATAAILRTPSGCFEQVSSSNYPNVLALQFLKHSGKRDPRFEAQATKLLKSGYDQLAAYEIKGGGFEWFGHPPAHEGLTAYGLVQFLEMQNVFNGVDRKLVERTTQWLLSRRDGKGGFRQSSGKYGFSAADNRVTNAYLTYALSEAGITDIKPEFENAFDEVIRSQDMYRMALVANAAYNLKRFNDYETLVAFFRQVVHKSGLDAITAEHSIVRSYGSSLQTETIALWAIALMKRQPADIQLLAPCINKIIQARSFGRFGSTQATALSLKVLVEYSKLITPGEDGNAVELSVNGKLAANSTVGNGVGNLVITGFDKSFAMTGNQTVRVRFGDRGEPRPYSVDIQWYSLTPPSNPECQVDLGVALNKASVALNDLVRLTATLTNKSEHGLPMTVAVIGIPAGLSPQPWQLKELMENGVVDFYEIIDGKLAIYYRELAPAEERVVNLDLKADVPGEYKSPASCAYVYYTDEFKHWVEGTRISIE